MRDQDEIEQERQEAATEEPATVPQHMPTKLPSGFDGVEPGEKEMERGKRRLFKSKHISSCHGTYIYDYICINDAHIRANLHYDNGGLEHHATIWLNEGERCFCYATFNTCSAVKCDYIVRGMISGLAKRLVYHHKNLIKRKAKWAAAKAAKREVA